MVLKSNCCKAEIFMMVRDVKFSTESLTILQMLVPGEKPSHYICDKCNKPCETQMQTKAERDFDYLCKAERNLEK